MITIRITNAKQAVRQNKGWLVAKLGGLFADLEERVEAAVADRIRSALIDAGVEAVVERVPTPKQE